MKRIVIIVLSNLFIISTYSQGYLWGKSTGNTGVDYGRSIFVDGAGAVYTVGQFSGTVDFDPGVGVQTLTSAGLTDVYIQKLTSAGVYVFAKKIGGTGDDVGYDVAVDPSGIIYIAGSFNTTVDFDPGAGTASSTSAGGTDAFVLKLTSLGNYSFHARFGSTGNDSGATIACNSSAFCIGGTFSETVDFDPSGGTSNLLAPAAIAGFIASFTTATAFTFAAQFNQTGSGITGLSMDATGNIYSTGYVNVAGDFDPGFGTVNFTTAGITDIFVSKLTNAGGYVWGKLFGGTGGESGVSVEFDAAGFIYHAGYFTGTCDFDPDGGVSNLTSGGSNDSYVCKLNSDGSLVWAKSFSGIGDDHGQTVDTDVNGNVFVGGYFRNTVDFDPGIGTQNRAVAGLIDGFVCKLNPSGQYINVVQIGGAAANEVAQDLSVDASGNIHIVGYYGGTVDVDPTFATANLISAGAADIMVLKWSPCGLTPAPSNATTLTNSIICGTSGNTNLSATGSGTIGWYSAASGGTYLGGGSTFNTGTISVPTTFYAQDSVCIASARTAISVTFNSLATDQLVTPITTNICSGGSATITVGSTQTNVFYTLVNDATNALVAGPTQGTGSAMNFNVSGVTATTVYNVTAKKPNVFNGALDLDGVNDYANLGGNSRGISTTMTVSAKIKTSVTPSVNQYFLSKYDGTTGFTMYIDPTGRVAFYGRDGGLVRSSGLSTTIITDNQWHEITGVVSNTTGWEIYVDGVLENTGSFATNTGVGNLTNFTAGNYNTSYSPIDIDQLAIWNTALSPAQILANTNSCLVGNEVNLTGFFKFNETAGTSVSDNSSTAVNGTLVNMTAPACWIAGAMNNSCTSYCDREMSQLVTVSVSDNVSPVANTPSLVNINASCQVSSLTAPTATDNCAGTLTGTHNATLPISISTTITWTYNDGNGNTTTQTQLVIINDITGPVANSPSLANLNSQCPITTLTAPTATDNCAGTITATHNVILPLTTNQTITWTYSDGNGNASSQTQLVFINDNTAPVATLPTLPNLTSQCQITSLTAPTANDNCAGTITGTPNVTLPLTTNQTITWTYSDGQGNASSQTQLVLINDNTAPVANVLSLATLTSQCAITTLTAPTATDNCAGTVTGTPSVTLPLIFNQTITWTYSDVQGNTTTQTQLVVVNDVTAPVANLTSLPALTDQCSITSLTAPTATDNCVGNITGTTTTTLPISSSTTITWTYSDGIGNTSTQNQSVVINDNTSPVASAVSLPDLTATCSITTLSAPTATDNCAGLLNGTTSTSLPINASMSIIWTYNDGHGNITTQNQNVIINDNIDPVPNSASLTNITSVCPVTSLTAPTANDNCAGVITATSNAIFPITGTQVITWTYTDGNSNTITQTQNVSVNDNVAPVPNSSTLTALQSSCAITGLTAPTATDNCAGQITGTTSTILPITSPGTITWTFTDLNGNSITQDQTVDISAMNVNVNQVEITLTAQNSSATSYQWIDCNNGNLAISGATNQSFTAVSNGNYAVIINEGNCVDTSACFAITTVGLFINSAISNINLHPNPTLNHVTINSNNSIDKVEIYATSGELIQTEFTTDFSVALISSGMYLVKVYTSQGINTLRLIKE